MEKARAWRFVLATRLMGVRPLDDQASDAVRDMFDALIALRCEVNALHAALVEADLLDRSDVVRRIGEAAEELCATYEAVFPGLWVDDDGNIQYNENGKSVPATEAKKAPN